MTIAPTDIAGLAFWAKADQISGNDGDAVATWADQSGNSRDLTQSDSNLRPALKKAANGINGKNVVRFNASGTDDKMIWTGGGLDIARNVAGFTLFVLAKPANTSQVSNLVVFTVGTSTNGRILLDDNSFVTGFYSIGRRRLDADGGVVVQGGAIGTTTQIFTARFDFTNTLATLFQNGAQTGNDAAFQTSGSTSDTASVEAGVSNDFAGDIAEIVIYPSALSTLDRQRIEWYLAEKYAVAGVTDPDAAAQVATPAISPNGGTFTVATDVTLTCATAGASIYYTTDGSTPDDTDTLYTVPFTLSADATVKAIGIKAAMTDSAVASAVFDIEIASAGDGGSRIFSGSGGNDGFFRNQN